jgi:hypothetical protein
MRATQWVLLFVALSVCCLSAQDTYASDARTDALVVQREYLEDYVNFRTFPTVAARYQNLVTASLGTAAGGDDRSVGVIGAGDNTNYGVFAIYLNNVTRNAPGFGAVEQQQLDLTWAKAFSGATIGLGLLWTKSSFNQDPAGETPIGGGVNDLNNPNANQTALTAGAKFDMNSNAVLEVAGQVGWWSWEEKDGAGTVISEDAGNISYSLAGRIMSEVSNRTTLVPLIKYGKMDLTADPGAGTEENVTRSMLNLGVALQYEVNGNDMLILGVSGDYVKDEDVAAGIDESTWSLPALFAALEFDVYSWLTVRTGARKTFDKFSDDVSNTDIKDSSYSFGLGMGLHFDNFDVDATVEPDALFTGGYLFSGDASQEPLTKITATYFF